MTRLAELRRAADCCRDVVAHLGEGVAATLPSFVLIITRDQVGADVADGEFGDVLANAEPRHQGERGAAQMPDFSKARSQQTCRSISS